MIYIKKKDVIPKRICRNYSLIFKDNFYHQSSTLFISLWIQQSQHCYLCKYEGRLFGCYKKGSHFYVRVARETFLVNRIKKEKIPTIS